MIWRITFLFALCLGMASVAHSFDDFDQLSTAVSQGHLKQVRQILAQGVDVNRRDDDGYTALMVAARDGQLEIARYLIQHGANVNFQNWSDLTALMVASQQGHVDVVKLLLDHKAQVNVKVEHTGMTPLLMAIDNNHLDVAKALAAAGGDLHEKNKNGMDALGLAEKENRTEIVAWLKSQKQ